jgi:uncharacterized lipoprotein YajG
MSAQPRATLLLALAVVALTGCARHVTLDVGYPEAATNRAMLSAARPRRVEIRPVADRRDDTARIGVQPEGDKPIVTSRPVSEIVRDALATEVRRNGHTLADGGADLVLAADVDEFWLDVVVGYSSAQYVGKVALAVAVIDARTGETLLTRRYVGIRRQQARRDAKQAGLEVMETALSRAMHDLATDAELASAFGRRIPGIRNI